MPLTCHWSGVSVNLDQLCRCPQSGSEDLQIAWDLIELWVLCFQTDQIILGSDRQWYTLNEDQKLLLQAMAREPLKMIQAFEKKNDLSKTGKSCAFFESSFWSHCMNTLVLSLDNSELTCDELAYMTVLIFSGACRWMPTQFLTEVVYVYRCCQEVHMRFNEDPESMSDMVGLACLQLTDHCMQVMDWMMTLSLEDTLVNVKGLKSTAVIPEDPQMYNLLQSFLTSVLEDEVRLTLNPMQA